MINEQILKAMNLNNVVKNHCNEYEFYFKIKDVFYNNGIKNHDLVSESYNHPTLGSEIFNISPFKLKNHTAFVIQT